MFLRLSTSPYVFESTYIDRRTLASTAVSSLPVLSPGIAIPPGVLLRVCSLAIAVRSAADGSVRLGLPQLAILADPVDCDVLVLASGAET